MLRLTLSSFGWENTLRRGSQKLLSDASDEQPKADIQVRQAHRLVTLCGHCRMRLTTLALAATPQRHRAQQRTEFVTPCLWRQPN